jgi:hypothetical protein
MVSYRHAISADDIISKTGRVKPSKLERVLQEADINMKEAIRLLCDAGGAAKPRIDKGISTVFFHTHRDLTRICIDRLVQPMVQASKRPPGLQPQLMTASELLEGYHNVEKMHQWSVNKLRIAEQQLYYLENELYTKRRDLNGINAVGHVALSIFTLGLGAGLAVADRMRLIRIIEDTQILVNEKRADVREQRAIDPCAKLAGIQRLIDLWKNAA